MKDYFVCVDHDTKEILHGWEKPSAGPRCSEQATAYVTEVGRAAHQNPTYVHIGVPS